jgi:hypothetical protein
VEADHLLGGLGITGADAADEAGEGVVSGMGQCSGRGSVEPCSRDTTAR